MGFLGTGGSPTLISSCPVGASYGANVPLNKAGDLGQYDFNITMTGRVEHISFKVAWEDRGGFINWAAGYSTGSGGAIVRNQPLQDPYCTYLYCVGIAGKGIGADGRVTSNRPWPWVILTLEFSTLPWDPNGATPYFTVRYRGSTSVATVPGAKLQFVTGEYIDHDYGILLGQYAIELTLYQVPDIDQFLTTFDPLKGQVNSDDVTIRGFTYPAGTLLLNTLDAEMQVNSGGLPQNQCTVSLISRSIPWNSDIDSNGTVQEVTPNPYLTTEFAPAFS